MDNRLTLHLSPVNEMLDYHHKMRLALRSTVADAITMEEPFTAFCQHPSREQGSNMGCQRCDLFADILNQSCCPQYGGGSWGKEIP